MEEKVLQECGKRGRMLTVAGGWLTCPFCRNRRVMRIMLDTTAKQLPVFCRVCRHEFRVEINRGQCFESQSQ
ncbi:MAG: cysteine-rich KTR domain-containing protein [Oscillospiraceae bacterium]|nr:cysteine-rich KTR domain-containing protein [Oscillospiraceae bacterium]